MPVLPDTVSTHPHASKGHTCFTKFHPRKEEKAPRAKNLSKVVETFSIPKCFLPCNGLSLAQLRVSSQHARVWSHREHVSTTTALQRCTPQELLSTPHLGKQWESRLMTPVSYPHRIHSQCASGAYTHTSHFCIAPHAPFTSTAGHNKHLRPHADSARFIKANNENPGSSRQRYESYGISSITYESYGKATVRKVSSLRARWLFRSSRTHAR